MRVFNYFITFIIVCCCFNNTYSQQKQPVSNSLKKTYQEKVLKYLQKEDSVSQHFSINDSGIFTYKSLEDKSLHNPEFAIKWNELELYKHLSKNASQELLLEFYTRQNQYKLPVGLLTDLFKKTIYEKSQNDGSLKGKRIAIDPGHIAGNMDIAKIEKKFVEFKAGKKNEFTNDINLIEGNLTLSTALLLKQRLEAEGAIVFLTREKQNTSSFGNSFEDWLKKDYKKLLKSAYEKGEITKDERKHFQRKAGKKEIFERFYNDLDLKNRARLINEFVPDVTVVIHYNADDKNIPLEKPTERNFNMVFVPGGFKNGELKEAEERMNFLRLLIGNDIESSIDFSKEIIDSFKENLNVPIPKPEDTEYLILSSMATDKEGVYARNLTLTRLINGTLVYGETLYQDNINECVELNKQEIKIGNIKTSKRVKSIADAYFEGISNYFKNTSDQ